MAAGDFGLVRYGVANFFGTLSTARPFWPVTTLLIKIVMGIIESEAEPDAETKKKLEWIYNNTHEKLKIHISIVELAAFRNLEKGINYELNFNIKGQGNRRFTVCQLYQYLDEVTRDLTLIVIKIAKKYNLEIPIQNYGSSGVSNFSMKHDTL